MRVLLTESELHDGVEKLASEIDAHYGDRPLTVIAIMTGSLVLFADLIRRLSIRSFLSKLSTQRGYARQSIFETLRLLWKLLFRLHLHHIQFGLASCTLGVKVLGNIPRYQFEASNDASLQFVVLGRFDTNFRHNILMQIIIQTFQLFPLDIAQCDVQMMSHARIQIVDSPFQIRHDSVVVGGLLLDA